MASSVRLLKLLPNDGPTWLFSSMAATRRSPLRTNRSQDFVGRKYPGNASRPRLFVNRGVRKTIGVHQIDHEVDEAIHVLARSHARTFSLVGLALVGLFLSGMLTTIPKRSHCVTGLPVVICKVEWHRYLPRARNRIIGLRLVSPRITCGHS